MKPGLDHRFQPGTGGIFFIHMLPPPALVLRQYALQRTDPGSMRKQMRDRYIPKLTRIKFRDPFLYRLIECKLSFFRQFQDGDRGKHFTDRLYLKKRIRLKIRIAAPLAGQCPHRPVCYDFSVLHNAVTAGPYPSFPDQILDEAVQVIQT